MQRVKGITLGLCLLAGLVSGDVFVQGVSQSTNERSRVLVVAVAQIVTNTEYVVVSDAGSSNPQSWGTYLRIGSTNVNGWIYKMSEDGTYGLVHSPENELYNYNDYGMIVPWLPQTGSGGSATGDVYIVYLLTTNLLSQYHYQPYSQVSIH